MGLFQNLFRILRSRSLKPILMLPLLIIVLLYQQRQFYETRKYIDDLQKELAQLKLSVSAIPNVNRYSVWNNPAVYRDIRNKEYGSDEASSRHGLEHKISTTKRPIYSLKSKTKPTVEARVRATKDSEAETKVAINGLKNKSVSEKWETTGYTAEQGAKSSKVQVRQQVKAVPQPHYYTLDNISYGKTTRLETKLLLRRVQVTQPRLSFESPKHVNPHDFAYLINNESLCSPTSPPHHLIYFHSAPASAHVRMALRQGWAQNGLFSKYPSRLVFFMGRPQNEKLMNNILKEADVFGDVVMEDYHDSYNNLTHKAIGALKWIANFCNKAKYAIKADQDVYVNRFRTLQLLTGEEYVNKTRFFMCKVNPENSVTILRDPKNCFKWCVPNDTFPNRTAYPQYCAGAMYVFTTDMAKELYHASLSTPYFHIDDVYLTGLLPKKVGNIKLIDVGPGSVILANTKTGKHVMHRNNATDLVIGIHGPYRDDPGYNWRDHVERLSVEQVAMLGRDKYQSLLQQTSNLQTGAK